ncbi:MAG: hypothetical protein EXQ56_04565 [Acidobacteria bacterium]|nr:hypothetical protein [Acidobacteriota bacterium]
MAWGMPGKRRGKVMNYLLGITGAAFDGKAVRPPSGTSRCAIILMALLMFAAATGWASDIQGVVKNAQGAAVAGARISVSDGQGTSRWEGTTAPDGTYRATALAAGNYTVIVTGTQGGTPLRRQIVVAEGGEPVQADFQFVAVAAAASASIAAEERNPNIFVYKIDLNDLRNRLTVGRGADATYTPQFSSDQNYFGAEFGAPLFPYEVLRPRNLLNDWRVSLYALHQNSKLNARNFFNVGPLLASRATSYSATANGPLFSNKTSLLLQYANTLTSGAVNGNVQSPRSDQRTPTTSDPAKRAYIASLLRAYPLEEPNLGATRLNTNASRDVDAKDALARFDYKRSDADHLAVRYTASDYVEVPFQIIAGQNPQTDVRTQGGYLSWTRVFSPATTGRFAFNYDRTAASLLPTRRFTDLFTAIGVANVPDVDFQSDEFTDIGPLPQFPRVRAQNRFTGYGDVSRTSGRHTFKAGWSTTRVRLNDLQSDNGRGVLRFSSDFGRTEVQNFLEGTPSTYLFAVGNFYRGFRNWEHFVYFEDSMRLRPNFTLTAGVRYELATAPVEVNHLTDTGYDGDANNFAPRFGFAWTPGGGKTVVRGGYGISHAQIQGVSYGMTRFNSPQVRAFTVNAPDLLNPLGGNIQQRPETIYRLSPDLIPSYTHHYSFGLERAAPGGLTLRAGYVGTRTFHLLTQQVYNRARPRTTIPNTTATIQQRRPDQGFADIIVIESSSNGYYDALILGADKRLSNGLVFRAQYSYSKNIDTGGDFTNTATGVERPPETGTSTCELCDFTSDKKGVSLFDTTQALVVTYSYNLPFAVGTRGLVKTLFAGWQISGVTNLQSGTPYHMHTGGDGPGVGNVDGWGQDRPNIKNPELLGMSFDDPDTSQLEMGAITADGRPGCARVAGGFSGTYLDCLYFDTNLPLGGRGNIGMNVFRKDGTHNWNLAIGKTFPLPGGRERSLAFRGEFINFFNHAQFDKANVQMSGNIFGQITNTANKGRQVQFSLRLNF